VFGAAAYILLEEWIPELMELIQPGWGQHWWVIFGPVLIILVLYAKQGLWGLIPDRSRRDD
jgi:branched-chain amino acid transport system permease protein